ncbi:hypothetical protein FGO68_gene10919 [Halteria grandinella]|uniref:Uncharacterized protein n=1 Tax=Halteria grandinella TaxID=5974 RepID=A0A8J8NGH1_HALGN|nr:hypothetical protein FGO68_gene10919 [Halteria grandinella]
MNKRSRKIEVSRQRYVDCRLSIDILDEQPPQSKYSLTGLSASSSKVRVASKIYWEGRTSMDASWIAMSRINLAWPGIQRDINCKMVID